MPGRAGSCTTPEIRRIAERPKHPLLALVSAAEMLPGTLPGLFLKKPFRPAALVAVEIWLPKYPGR